MEKQVALHSPAVPSRGDLHKHIVQEEGAEVVAEAQFLFITFDKVHTEEVTQFDDMNS